MSENKIKNFVLIGVAGYIAPRHLKAIKDTGNHLVAAIDKHDCVGIIDRYFPDADFFTEFERFDRHIDKLQREGISIDYVVVCTPNYLHDAHIRFGLRIGANVICEKPLVLNPWNVDALQKIEQESVGKVYTILQLRLHPSIIALKNKIDTSDPTVKHQINLDYVTARGKWYHYSWKGDISKSGGIATNIGVHFFDMLVWIFGEKIKNTVTHHSSQSASGLLQLSRADIKWSLSINAEDLPTSLKKENKQTYRSLTIDNETFEFSDGFTDLHTVCYEDILKGGGYGIAEAKAAIELVSEIRNQTPIDDVK